MNNELVRNEIIIDWNHVFMSIAKKWWVILICLVVGTVLGLGLGIRADVPVYECEAVYVLSYSGGDSVNQMSSEYSFLTRILYNCTVVLSQNTFTQKIADEINEGVSKNSDGYITAEDLRKCITYDYSTQGTVINVIVDTADAKLSYRIISSIAAHLQEHIKEQYHLAGSDDIVFSLANTPELPDKPVESNVRLMFTLIGAVAFAFISLAIIAFGAMFDTRIKKEEDLKNHFNAPVLGTIPNFYDSELYKGGYYKYGSNEK